MRLNAKLTTWGLLAAVAAASVSPALADGYQDRANLQNSKNTMRNLGIAGAAVGVLGLLDHNNTLALLGGAGAVLAGSQYEQDRRQQSQDNRYYYYRDGRNDDHGWDRNNWGGFDRSDHRR